MRVLLERESVIVDLIRKVVKYVKIWYHCLKCDFAEYCCQCLKVVSIVTLVREYSNEKVARYQGSLHQPEPYSA